MTTERLDCDDIGEAIQEGRPLRPAKNYRFRAANSNLKFRSYTLSDPVPLGRQILEAMGLSAQADICLFAILKNGDFEDVRLDETFDLRGRGVEKFIAFSGDRIFKFRVNGRQLFWGLPTINGAQLHKLSGASDVESVFLEVPGGTDLLIAPDDVVDLTQAGIERFITAPTPLEFEITINSRPFVWSKSKITFEEVLTLASLCQNDPNVIYTMTFRFADANPSSGTVIAGHSICIKSGTQINVTPTVQS